MRTTLVIDDQMMARLRREAERQNRTISELVEAALRLLLDRRPREQPLPELPTFRGGGLLVDVADRESLDASMG